MDVRQINPQDGKDMVKIMLLFCQFLNYGLNCRFIPFSANMLLLGMIVNSLYIDELVDDPCIMKNGYKFWLQVQAVILCLTCFSICLLYFKIIEMEKKKGKQLEYLNVKKNICPKKFFYWIRQKGLMSNAGFSVLILGLINLLWVGTGFRRYYYHHSYDCAQSFQNTLYANIIVPSMSIIHFALTLIGAFLIKLFCLIFSMLSPSLFLSFKKKF